MDLRQLEYFVAVADAQQFTRAAEQVSVAQPAVSQQIRRLERELGEALFHRDARSVRLTAAGEALLPHARAALGAAKRGRDSVASLHGLLRGRLRIGVARAPVDPRLAATLGQFHRANPAIELQITEYHNEPLVDLLADGGLDAALIGISGRKLPPQLGVRVIAVEPLVLVVAARHPLSARSTITFDDLRQESIVTLIAGSGLRVVLERACRDAGFTPRITAEAGDLGLLVELAAEGIGVALVPRSAVAAPAGQIALVQIDRPQLQRPSALAWNEANASPAARAFLRIAERHLPGLPARSASIHTR